MILLLDHQLDLWADPRSDFTHGCCQKRNQSRLKCYCGVFYMSGPNVDLTETERHIRLHFLVSCSGEVWKGEVWVNIQNAVSSQPSQVILVSCSRCSSRWQVPASGVAGKAPPFPRWLRFIKTASLKTCREKCALTVLVAIYTKFHAPGPRYCTLTRVLGADSGYEKEDYGSHSDGFFKELQVFSVNGGSEERSCDCVQGITMLCVILIIPAISHFSSCAPLSLKCCEGICDQIKSNHGALN